MNERDREPQIHETAYVAPSVELGDWSRVGANAQIYGKTKIGRAAWICENAIIGGGQQELGSLEAGDFLHLGIRSMINIASPVSIGDEVGLGMDTKIFTHGGYLSELEGFPFQRGPVSIGERVWLPYAIVLPQVGIGNNVVVAAMSLVHRDLPSGCLAAGVPAKILRNNAFPELEKTQPILKAILQDAKHYGTKNLRIIDHWLKVGDTTFYPLSRDIEGPVNYDTAIVKNLFRRRGIRFRYYDNKGVYQEWD
jgi:acetyltransferase-like isoleucine patch superfamily enzyme